MRYLFFDTSALVKRYYREPGTETVDELVEDADTQVVITTLAVVETASAFRRKYDRDEIGADRMNELLASFFGEALAEYQFVSADRDLAEVACAYDLDTVVPDGT